ncbi:hypothetical protein C8J31_11679 [Rhizobium sp. PP-CC-2G-626]|nr:hypothetical protein C8J31_11679 [Rhizobium sp. PP-CC-2G-626]
MATAYPLLPCTATVEADLMTLRRSSTTLALPHPRRYAEAFRGQLARLERLYPNLTYPGSGAAPSRAFEEIECAGVSTLMIARRNVRLRHLEALIADWRSDGEATFHAEVDSKSIGAPTLGIVDVPRSVSFVEFDAAGLLDVESRPRSRVEGFYVREVMSEGAFAAELTFVCLEPGWKTMETCRYADAMEVGSRISVGIVALGEETTPALAASCFAGDIELSGDPAIERAIAAAGDFLIWGLCNRPSASSPMRRFC